MLNYIRDSPKTEFIIGTEQDMVHRLKKELPAKTYYTVTGAVCPTMKLITLENIIAALETLTPEITLDAELMERAKRPLQRMLDIGRGD
jgi:quinolinate synthase